MNAPDPANHVLVHLDTESQPDLLGNVRTAPSPIALFHCNDCLTRIDSATTERRPLGRASWATVTIKWRKRTTTSRTLASYQNPTEIVVLVIRHGQAFTYQQIKQLTVSDIPAMKAATEVLRKVAS
jgi:hypothetical protein